MELGTQGVRIKWLQKKKKTKKWVRILMQRNRIRIKSIFETKFDQSKIEINLIETKVFNNLIFLWNGCTFFCFILPLLILINLMDDWSCFSATCDHLKHCLYEIKTRNIERKWRQFIKRDVCKDNSKYYLINWEKYKTDTKIYRALYT